MPTLEDLIRRAQGTVEHARAKALAKNDYKLLADLVQVRKSRGLSQSDIAERLGISQQAVSKLESYDSDPRLSTVRRYALAVEALVAHAVEADNGQLADGATWMSTTFTTAMRPSKTYVTARASSYKRTDLAIAA
jgi:transcriptional regulator with XRE-family HTH domain